MFMSRPTSIFGIMLMVCLETSAATGHCAGTNDQASFGSRLNTGGDSDPVQYQNYSNFESNYARKLSPNDAISMIVYQEEDLNTKTIIDKNGMVMLPLLGQVKIGGLSTRDATERIQQLYNRDYLVNPRVNLVVEEFAKLRFAVLGQVQRPGSFDFPQNESVNLLEAIAMAGGYTRLGAPSEVRVSRIVNGVPKTYHLNASEMSGNTFEAPFVILPEDLITVGERTF
jgi:polysaccharide export outer membrane protein